MEFKSMTEGIDTTTQMRRIWLMLSAVFAENEREVIRERTNAGLDSARARGITGWKTNWLKRKSFDKGLLSCYTL